MHALRDQIQDKITTNERNNCKKTTKKKQMELLEVVNK